MTRVGKQSGLSGDVSSEPSGARKAAQPAKKQVRFTREETTARILDAAEELFSHRDPNAVTVREIASRAGVTHALVHQYVGTKAEVLNAVIVRSAPDRTRMISEMPDLHTVMPLLFSDVLDRRVHSRAIVRSALAGVEYTAFPDRIETGMALVDLAAASKSDGVRRLPTPEAMDPRLVMAAVVAMVYGWVATESWLVEIFDLADEDPAEVRRQLIEVLMTAVDLVLPPNEEPGAGET